VPAIHSFCNKRRYHHLDEDAGSLTAADVLPQPVVVSYTLRQTRHLCMPPNEYHAVAALRQYRGCCMRRAT
jgi:hypothetical protein